MWHFRHNCNCDVVSRQHSSDRQCARPHSRWGTFAMTSYRIMPNNVECMANSRRGRSVSFSPRLDDTNRLGIAAPRCYRKSLFARCLTTRPANPVKPCTAYNHPLISQRIDSWKNKWKNHWSPTFSIAFGCSYRTNFNYKLDFNECAFDSLTLLAEIAPYYTWFAWHTHDPWQYYRNAYMSLNRFDRVAHN